MHRRAINQPLVKEVHAGASFFYFATGQRTEEKAELFAQKGARHAQQRAGSGRRLAVDKIQIAGLRALEAAGHRSHGWRRIDGAHACNQGRG